MGVPSDRNISAKEFEKLRKYEDLEIEIPEIRKMKTKTIPVIVVAPGIIKKETQKNANEIPGNTDYFTPKLCFYANFIRIFLHNFTQYSLYATFTQSKFTAKVPTKTIRDQKEIYTNTNGLVSQDIGYDSVLGSSKTK